MTQRVATPIPLEIFQGETKALPITVVDDSGVAIDITTATLLRFVVYSTARPPAGVFKSEVIAVTAPNIATVTVPGADVATPRVDLEWTLWDIGPNVALAWGSFEILPAVQNVL